MLWPVLFITVTSMATVVPGILQANNKQRVKLPRSLILSPMLLGFSYNRFFFSKLGSWTSTNKCTGFTNET